MGGGSEAEGLCANLTPRRQADEHQPACSKERVTAGVHPQHRASIYFLTPLSPRNSGRCKAFR